MNRLREVLIRLFAKINHYIVARQWYLGTFYIYVCRLIDVINNYRHSQEIFEWLLKDFGVRPYSMGHTEPDILVKKFFYLPAVNLQYVSNQMPKMITFGTY